MKIIILSKPDCASCIKLENSLDELKIKYEVVDVTQDLEIFQKHPLSFFPGILINGKLEYVGAPNINDLKKLLSNY